MKPVAVVSAGAVSALGLGLWQHAMFSRAEVGPDAGGAFLDDEGETISCGYCGWLAPGLPIAERVGNLAVCALRDAWRSFGDLSPNSIEGTRVELVLAAPAMGWRKDDSVAVADAMAGAFAPASVREGSSAFFDAVANASASLAAGEREVAGIVSADSWISAPRLAAYRAELFDPWGPSLPRPAEGAAAVVLMSPEGAARRGLVPLATIEFAGTGSEASHDDNDEPLDGGALSLLLHQAVSSLGPRRVRASFGPFDVGSLRRDSWNIAAARNAWCFDPDPDEVAIEALVGHVGAASAALNFVFGVGSALYRALPDPDRHIGAGAVLSGWGLSRSGQRGLLLAQSNPNLPAERRVATVGALRALPLRQPLEHLAPPLVACAAEASDGAPPPTKDEVTMDPERLSAVAFAEREASVQTDLLDRVSALLRMRATDGQHELPRQEARILSQLDAMPASGMTPDALVAHGLAALADEDPWMAAGAMVGLCAMEPSGAGLDQVLAALTNDIEPVDAALAAVASPGSVDVVRLGRHALGQPSAIAFGLELLSMHASVSASMLVDRLGHEDPGVVRSALRAWSRLLPSNEEPFHKHVTAIIGCLGHAHPDVRFEASRTLALHGVDEPLRRLRDGDALMQSMGVGAVELCVMAGALSDMPHVERAIFGLDVDAELLDAIARYGHPGSWAFLLRHLDDPEHEDQAAQALRTLFGDLVSDDDERRSAVWRDALAARNFDQSVRLRRGRPWSAEVLMAECRDPNASRREIAHRCDELACGNGEGGRYASILHRWQMSVDEVLGHTRGT